MASQDLRSWLSDVEAIGELKQVEGAAVDTEIGGIVDLAMEQVGRPALLFDRIPGFAPGRRVLGNVLVSKRRIALTCGLDPEASPMDVVRTWRRFFNESPRLPYRTVPGGPLLEHLYTGDQIRLKGFPAPRWHEHDGGFFIGTGSLIVMKDPESGWVNVSVQRIQVHEDSVTGIMISPGKHADIIMRKYWAMGKPCPIAVSTGHHPLYMMLAGASIPYGICEYDMVGGFRGEPVETIAGPVTGLPLPADAELALEGEIPPPGEQSHAEGPFGEFTGYYAAPERDLPVIRVKSVMHRHDPINLGIVPGKPPNDNSYFLGFIQSALVWSQMEQAGIPGIEGVWFLEPGGAKLWITVSLRQMYPGHARQAALVATSCLAGGYMNRVTVAVDEDIDPTNAEEVIWAIASRIDPRQDVEILHRTQSSALDPMSYPETGHALSSRMVIDACRPWERLKDFPLTARSSPELRAATVERWGNLFGLR